MEETHVQIVATVLIFKGKLNMTLIKPPNVADDPILSKKWDELCEGHDFKASEAQTLALLCQWYVIYEQCSRDIADASGQVAYQADNGDLKALPQLSIMKNASAEIRQLTEQLGLLEQNEQKQSKKGETTLALIQGRRRTRANVSTGA